LVVLLLLLPIKLGLLLLLLDLLLDMLVVLYAIVQERIRPSQVRLKWCWALEHGRLRLLRDLCERRR
jgi:hypothetical protein